MFITATLTACNDADQAIPTQASNKLNITVGLNPPQSRAGIITGSTLADGSTIGILLDDGAETDYDAVNNIKFTASTQDAKQVWTPATDIVLSDTKGTLYAYYPYAEGTNLSAIPVETATQTDYLYATPVQNVNESNASVAVTLNHMLTNVKVAVNRGTYVGTGNISNITIQSDGFATGGTFNAAQATPAFSSVTGTGNELSRTVTATLGGTATDIMVVPTGNSQTMTFTVTIDGENYTATSTDVELEEGNSYEYTLSLNSTFMSIASVAVNPWTTVPKESLTLEKYVDTTPQVFAVKSDGSLIDVASADNSCVAVALIVNDVVDAEGNPNPQRLMIEKNGEANTTSIKAAYTADGVSNTNYTYFYWGMDGADNTSITNYTKTGDAGTSSSGNLPLANGSYANSSNNLSGDYTTWTSGALSDFNGKTNTTALLEASDTDSNTTFANMATWCRIFNQTATENQGYTDWYIPALGQLSLMYLNMTAINNALTKIGGQTIASSGYLSSSEFSSNRGWGVGFHNGYVYYNFKSDYSRVRFVRDI